MALAGPIEYIDGTVTVLSTGENKSDERLDRMDERLDKATQIVGQLQHRVGTIEGNLEPGAVITDEQAVGITSEKWT